MRQGPIQAGRLLDGSGRIVRTALVATWHVHEDPERSRLNLGDEIVCTARWLTAHSARYLEENAVDEWRRAYINYRGLKKLIKRVAEHRAAREACAQTEASSSGVHTVQSSASRLLARRKSHFFLGGARQDGGYGATQRCEGQPQVPEVSLKGTGLGLLDERQDTEAETPYHLLFGKTTNEPMQMADTEESTEEEGRPSAGTRNPPRRTSTWVVPQTDRMCAVLTQVFPICLSRR